jgi:hypothetical protein
LEVVSIAKGGEKEKKFLLFDGYRQLDHKHSVCVEEELRRLLIHEENCTTRMERFGSAEECFITAYIRKGRKGLESPWL